MTESNTVFMFVSQCMGVGKTSLCREMKELFDIVHLSQDNLTQTRDVASIFSENVNYEAFTTNNKDKFVVIDKNNHHINVREKTFPLENRRRVQTYYIVMEHPKGKQAFSTRAYNNISQRTNHPTLEQKNALPAINKFSNDYQPLTQQEKDAAVGIITLDISLSQKEVFRSFCSQLVEFDILETMPNDEKIEAIVAKVKKEMK